MLLTPYTPASFPLGPAPGGLRPESGACRPHTRFHPPTADVPRGSAHFLCYLNTITRCCFVAVAQHYMRLTHVQASHPRPPLSRLHGCNMLLTHPPNEHPGGCPHFPLTHKAAVMSHTCLFVHDTSASCPCGKKCLCRVPGIIAYGITLQSGSQPSTVRRNPHLSTSSLKFDAVVLNFS